jgi:hypothetical protein
LESIVSETIANTTDSLHTEDHHGDHHVHSYVAIFFPFLAIMMGVMLRELQSASALIKLVPFTAK